MGQHLTQALNRNDQHFSWLAYHRRKEHGLPGEEVELAQEAARAVDADDAFFASVVLDDGHVPDEDDEEIAARVAHAKQHFARFGRTPLSVRCQRVDLARAQFRERPVEVRGL